MNEALARSADGGLRPPSMRLACAAVALIHGAYLLAAGVTMAPDSITYAYWSERLVQGGFNYPTVLAEADEVFPPILYVLFTSLLAALRIAVGEGWATALVAINALSHLALCLLVVRLAVRTTKSAVAGWTALLLYLLCFGLLQWVPFVLSDATFLVIAFSIFFLAARRILGDTRAWTSVAALGAFGVFWRPTGIVLVPDLVWAAFLSRTARPLPRRGALLAALGAVVVAGTAAFAWFMADPARWPFDALASAFEVTSRDYQLGQVVSARPETYHAPPTGVADLMMISADRFVHFFAPGAATFSVAHWAVQLVFFLPCYALALWLVVVMWRGDTAFAADERRVFLAAIGAVLSYALFHSLVQVDFDWRYRAPILPHLILLAAGGAADLARRRTR